MGSTSGRLPIPLLEYQKFGRFFKVLRKIQKLLELL